MLQTLVWIPAQAWGWDVFGIGWLLGLWLVIASGVTVRQLVRQGMNRELWESLPLFALVAGGIIFILPRMLELSPAGIPGLPIRGFGVMLLLAIVAGVGLCMRRAEQVGINPDHIISLAFWMIVAGIIGARLFYVIQYWPKFIQPTVMESIGEILNAAKGGLVVYGSVIGGCLPGWIYLKKNNLPLWEIADVVAPGMILGQAIGRLGCFMNGCCFGGLCTLPLAVTFPAESPVYMVQREAGTLHGFEFRSQPGPQPGGVVGRIIPGSPAAAAGLVSGDVITAVNGWGVTNADEGRLRLALEAGEVEATLADGRKMKWEFQPRFRSQPVHPTQLYSFVDALLLTIFLWCYYPFRRRPGEVFALLITLHPISRILLEWIRMDEPGQWGTGLTISQLLSFGFLIIAAGLWWYLERQPAVGERR
jgi:phosphatidylglycerol:prolipoprotein diacylglycerol transferase